MFDMVWSGRQQFISNSKIITTDEIEWSIDIK